MSTDAEPSAAPALVVIDPSPAEAERFEAAAGALGVPVTTIEPRALAPASLASLADARAVVVAWDLGVRAGLDVVEALARDPATAAVPVALAVDAPTRVHVELALRAGAATVVRRPCEPDELARALLARAGAAPASGTPAGAGAGTDAAASAAEEAS